MENEQKQAPSHEEREVQTLVERSRALTRDRRGLTNLC
jgi:hypothetical protein